MVCANSVMEVDMIVKNEAETSDCQLDVNTSLAATSVDSGSGLVSSSVPLSSTQDNKVTVSQASSVVDVPVTLTVGQVPGVVGAVPKVGDSIGPLKLVIPANSLRPVAPKTSAQTQLPARALYHPALLVGPPVTAPGCTTSPRKTVTVLPVGPRSQGLTAVINARPLAPAGQPVNIATRSPGKVTVLSLPKTSSVPGQYVTVVPSSGPATVATTSLSNNKPSVMPYKVLIRPPSAVAFQQLPVTLQASQVPRPVVGSTVQQLPVSVSGSKFQYIRLVTTTAPVQLMPRTASPPAKIMRTTCNATVVINADTTNSMSVLTTMASSRRQALNATSSLSTRVSTTQRLILPATTTSDVRGITSLAPSAGLSASDVDAMSHMRQAAKDFQSSSGVKSELSPSLSSAESSQQSLLSRQPAASAVVDEPTQKPRKPCNCTKSRCLKLYCDCFANGEFCNNCNCCSCANNLEHEVDRLRAIRACLERNPYAFHPKIGKGRGGDVVSRQHCKGCNCKRSGCLKNYCECYEAKILCSSMCRCFGCKNYEESQQRKTLMHLADAAEVRVLQQVAANSKLSTPVTDRASHRAMSTTAGRRPAYSLVTTDVIEAACTCLIATLEESSAMNDTDLVTERLVLEEFGRCLTRVVDSANTLAADQ